MPKTHLFKVSFDLLLIEKLDQQICHILYGVNSLYLEELLFEIFTYDVKSSLYMLRFLVRPGLLSEGYGTIVIAVQCNSITPSFAMNFLNQKASLAVLEVEMYLASMIESTMIGCLKLFQLTTPSLHKKYTSMQTFYYRHQL